MKKDLGDAFAHLPLIIADTAAVGYPVSYFRDWLTHDQPGDPYCTPTDFRPILPDLGVWRLQPGQGLATQEPPESDPDRYTYDPVDPTPAVGGTSTITFGPRDNRALEQRPDVLSYTTQPLTEQLEIIGPVAAELFVGSSRSHTDFFVRLCDVDEKGKSVNITDGILRLTDATEDPRRITVDLWPTAHRFAAGHRIRL
jgi:putative CocE/NonD family hydrolase